MRLQVTAFRPTSQRYRGSLRLLDLDLGHRWDPSVTQRYAQSESLRPNLDTSVPDYNDNNGRCATTTLWRHRCNGQMPMLQDVMADSPVESLWNQPDRPAMSRGTETKIMVRMNTVRRVRGERRLRRLTCHWRTANPWPTIVFEARILAGHEHALNGQSRCRWPVARYSTYRSPGLLRSRPIDRELKTAGRTRTNPTSFCSSTPASKLEL
ncbi:uncharacterized protein V1510DRAFT_301097 [Dipodascopsis tothii]|uniref:uncharacterized protein n=1 Tax=Dipodascopsis tothii TaxID=44089 RepID=UPI0034CFF6EE